MMHLATKMFSFKLTLGKEARKLMDFNHSHGKYISFQGNCGDGQRARKNTPKPRSS
jgi:hypothetical protein